MTLSLCNEDFFRKPSLGSNSIYHSVLELSVCLPPSLTHTVSSLRAGPTQFIYGGQIQFCDSLAFTILGPSAGSRVQAVGGK